MDRVRSLAVRGGGVTRVRRARALCALLALAACGRINYDRVLSRADGSVRADGPIGGGTSDASSGTADAGFEGAGADAAPPTRWLGGCNDDALPLPDGGLGSIRPNTWTQLPVTYRGVGTHASGGNAPLLYDCRAARVLAWDRWIDDAHGIGAYGNAVMELEGGSVARAFKMVHWDAAGNELPEGATEPSPVDRQLLGGFAHVFEQNAVYVTNGQNLGAGHPQETWKLDLASVRWERVVSRNNPPNIGDACMTYDPGARRLIYLNFSATAQTQTWLMDPSVGEWMLAQAPSAPMLSGGCSFAYDPVRERSIMFGGYLPFGTPRATTWAFDARTVTWTRLPDAPVPAYAPGLAYDSMHDVVVASVSDQIGATRNRMLVLNLRTSIWSELLPSGSDVWPPVASRSSLVYDARRDVFIALGPTRNGPRWYAFRYQP